MKRNRESIVSDKTGIKRMIENRYLIIPTSKCILCHVAFVLTINYIRFPLLNVRLYIV